MAEKETKKSEMKRNAMFFWIIDHSSPLFLFLFFSPPLFSFVSVASTSFTTITPTSTATISSSVTTTAVTTISHYSCYFTPKPSSHCFIPVCVLSSCLSKFSLYNHGIVNHRRNITYSINLFTQRGNISTLQIVLESIPRTLHRGQYSLSSVVLLICMSGTLCIRR